MTPHQRAARINKLRKELKRPSMVSRTKRRSDYERELAQLVVDRLRDNLRPKRNAKDHSNIRPTADPAPMLRLECGH